MSGPNLSSKALVNLNSAGRREKMKYLKTTKTQTIALFDRKTTYFKIFIPAVVNILICNSNISLYV